MESEGTPQRNDPEWSSLTLQKILSETAKSMDMEVAFVAEFADDQLVFRGLGGDATSFGWEEGGGIPLEGSYCKRVIDGRLPNAVPDARGDDRVKDLAVTEEAGIGSYCGVPLRLSDGTPYGTLCCVSHSADPWLMEKDLGLMENLARKLVRSLESTGRL